MSIDSHRSSAGRRRSPSAQTFEISLQPEQLAVIEAWRAANMQNSIEAAIVELVDRTLREEIADTASLMEQVRSTLGASGDGS